MTVEQASKALKKHHKACLDSTDSFNEFLDADEASQLLEFINQQQSEIDRLKAYEPKFKVDDTLYYYKQGRHSGVYKGNVKEVRHESNTLYFLGGLGWYKQSELFATKDEAEKSKC